MNARAIAPDILSPDELIGSRVIVQAASGGGKTYAIRRILEQTFGKMQHLVLDVEDELFTLREKFDYALIGGEGADIPITEASARALAQKLLELGVSAILQLNDLGLEGQRRTIAAFVQGLMNAPREHWHPVLVTLDEAHRYAPNPKVITASTEALTNLATAGRKRGFGAIFATQRLSQLSTDIRGQCPNRVIGRVDQALDRRAAAELLGFAAGGEEANGLMRLKHQFWVVGPAFAPEPRLHRFSPAVTTHLQVGHRAVPSPPTPDRLKALLGALAESAKAEAERPAAEGRKTETAASGQRRESDSRTYQEGLAAGRQEAKISKAALAAVSSRVARFRTELAQAVTTFQTSVDRALAKLEEKGFDELKATEVEGPRNEQAPQRTESAPVRNKAPERLQQPRVAGEIGAAARRFLDEAILRWPCKFTWSQLGVLVDRKTRGGSFLTARRELMDGGFVVEEGGLVVPTGQPDKRKPSKRELREMWLGALPVAASELLAEMIRVDAPIAAVDLAVQTNRQPRGGSWNTALSILKSNGLIAERTRGIFVLEI